MNTNVSTNPNVTANYRSHPSRNILIRRDDGSWDTNPWGRFVKIFADVLFASITEHTTYMLHMRSKDHFPVEDCDKAWDDFDRKAIEHVRKLIESGDYRKLTRASEVSATIVEI